MKKAQRLSKKEALEHWKGLPIGSGDRVSKAMRVVPYKHTGSTFTQDGIRLTGTREFIDSVLAILRPILHRENCDERLSLNYQESTDRESREPTGFWTCYIQVHKRGGEAQAMNAFASRIVGREVIASAGY